MFRKRRTLVNGVELPEEFAGASVINNVAISADGRRYACVSSDRRLITGEMPKDGRLKIGNVDIRYQRGKILATSGGLRLGFFGAQVCIGGGISSAVSVMSGGGGRICVSSGQGLEYKIDSSYDSVSSVTLEESARSVRLGLSDDGKVYVKGFTNTEPENRAGHLFIGGLEGLLQLPKNVPHLEIDIRNSAGNVYGDVAHKGRVITSTGDIALRLYAPLKVEAAATIGDVSVVGMISEGRRVYTPPNAKPIGTLRVETSVGDVNIEYMLR